MNYFIYTHPLGTESKKKQKKTTKKTKNICYTGKLFLQLNAKCHGRMSCRFLIN